MKITVCGKGGCGKSTVSALLAKEFERMGKTVLVADSDESNYGLHTEIARKGLLGNELMMEIPEIHTLARKILKQ